MPLNFTAPANGSTQEQPVTVSWDVIPDVDLYYIEIATDSLFTSIVWAGDVTTNSVQVSGVAYDAQFFGRGRTWPPPEEPAFVAMWKGSTFGDYLRSITVDDSGNIYLGGASASVTNNSNARCASIVKLNPEGILQWSRYVYSTSSATNTVILKIVGNYIYQCSRWVHSANYGSYDFCITKHDLDGLLIWKVYAGTSSADYSWNLDVDADGNVYISGQPRLIAKLDSNGSVLYCKNHDTSTTNTAYKEVKYIGAFESRFTVTTTETSGLSDTQTGILITVLNSLQELSSLRIVYRAHGTAQVITTTLQGTSLDEHNNNLVLALYHTYGSNIGVSTIAIVHPTDNIVIEAIRFTAVNSSVGFVLRGLTKDDSGFWYALLTAVNSNARAVIIKFNFLTKEVIWRRFFNYSLLQLVWRNGFLYGLQDSVFIRVKDNGNGLGNYSPYTYEDILPESDNYIEIDEDPVAYVWKENPIVTTLTDRAGFDYTVNGTLPSLNYPDSDKEWLTVYSKV